MEANPSNDVEDRKIGARKGGIAIRFHPGLQPLLHDRGSMAGNRVQWIKFQRNRKGAPSSPQYIRIEYG